MLLAEIIPIAEHVKTELAPYCSRIEIAGSIRRKKAQCGDIELVAIPDSYKLEEYFKKQIGKIIFSKNGPKYKQFRLQGCQIDLFLCSPDNWGLIFLIRTGSARFSERALARWKMVSNGGYSNEGYLYTKSGVQVKTPEETDVFNKLGWQFIQPVARVF